MATKIRGITIELGAEYSGLSKALSNINADLSKTQKSLNDVNKLLKLDPKNTELLSQKQQYLKDAISQTEDKLKAEKEAFEVLKNAPQTDETRRAQEALTREIFETENKLKSLEKEYKSFGSVAKQQIQEVGKEVTEVGNKMSDVGTKMSKTVTAPIVAVGTAAVAAFKEVDEGMDIIVTKTGATGEALEDMQKRAQNIATTIPTSFETAGTAIGEVNTRFEVTGDELEELSTQFIKFAEINGTDVNNSIDSVSKVMQAYNLTNEEASVLLDHLNGTGQATGISMDSLTSQLLTNASSFRSMGYTIEDSITLLGQLEVSGVDASDVLGSLGKVQKQAMTDGVSMENALKEAFSSSENAMSVFGKTGAKIFEMVDSGTLSVDMFTARGREMNYEVGSVSETFANTLDPAVDDATVAMNQMKVLGADIAEDLLPVLAEALKKVSSGIQQMKDKWDKLSPGTRDAIVKFALLVATIGPLIVVFGKIVSGAGMVISAVGALTPPVAAAIAIFTAFVAAGVYLYKHWDTLKEKATGLKNHIADKWNGMKSDVTGRWNDMKNSTVQTWDAIQAKVQANGGGIRGIIATGMQAYKSLWSVGFSEMDSITGGKLSSMVSTASSKLEEMRSAFSSKMESAKSLVSSGIEYMKGIFSGANFSFPHIKLPHFSVSGELSLVPPSVPHVSVDWYKKAMNNGRILNGATIFGMQDGKLLGGGESGSEAIVGTNSLQNMIFRAVRQAVGSEGGKVQNFTMTQNNYSPKALSTLDIYKNTHSQFNSLKAVVNNV